MSYTKYTYSIANAFPNAKVDTSRFREEIAESAIAVALDRIDTAGDLCDVWFKDALPGAQVVMLDGLVAAHSGEPLPPTSQLVTIDAPQERDRKPVFTLTPATAGFNTWLTSRGDDKMLGPAGRGKGPQLGVVFDGSEVFPATKVLEFEFFEPVEYHDGQFTWGPVANWGPEDEFSLSSLIPATVAAATPGAGNVNEVEIAPGLYTYVPAVGGSHTVDLASAPPVPAKPEGTGYWNCDYNTGEVTPNPAGSGDFNLLSFPVESWMIKNVSMTNPLGVFDIDVYKTEWMHSMWKARLSVTKTTPGAGKAYGWILCFRRNIGET